jgi:hypothetical protein
MTKQPPPVRTEIVEVPITAYAPVPAETTDQLPRPAPPPRNCLLRHALPAVCAFDALLWMEQWFALRDRANVDRASVKKLTDAPAGVRLNGSDGEGGP